ncbi:MAG TPA: preprotein translocase subunit SecY [bacterium]|nr:preprotein translocase subunit SecY [bacterium]
MISAISNSFKIPELKKKLFFTALMIAIYRLGSHIIIPGIDTAMAAQYFSGSGAGGWLGMINMFSGGAFKRFSIFALGIMPYISSSIILQLLTAVVPYLKKLSKEGEMGRKKITQYTRYGTILLSVIQATGLAIWLGSIENGALVQYHGFTFKLITVLTMTTGTTFIMWLGEQITERGIGNGISIIIFIGIVASIPLGVSETFMKIFKTEDLNIFQFLFMALMVLFIVAVVIVIQLGHRRIPVSYAKQVRGRKIYGGQSTHLPLKVDYSGVIAVIFASSLLMFPSTILNFLAGSNSNFLVKFVELFQENSSGNLYFLLYKLTGGAIGDGLPFTLLRVVSLYNIVFSALVIFFCYFYTTIVFNPKDLAENLKRQGGFVPGRRPGTATAEYIQTILMRITLIGALMVVFICVFPDLVEELISGNMPNTMKYLMGGTTILILVGVDLDTIQQIESQLLQRYYTGFVGGGKLRSRRGM